MSGTRVSVCMATYDGAAYVEEQVASVLAQLEPDDELVVVDDASRDATPDLVEGFGDERVRLVRHRDNAGSMRRFGEALTLARGEVLLLADQDDVWPQGRVEAMVAALERADVVAGNLTTLGGPLGIRGPLGQRDWRLRPEDSRRHVANVLGILAGARPYYGCAMGLRRRALAAVLPFPGYLVESHDLWIALHGNVIGSMRHLDRVVTERRLHGANQTPQRPRAWPLVLRSRWMLVRATLTLLGRRLRTTRPDRAQR